MAVVLYVQQIQDRYWKACCSRWHPCQRVFRHPVDNYKPLDPIAVGGDAERQHQKTKYFEPSTKDFMINYRVENLEALVEQLRAEGVTILDKIEAYDYGKFVHIVDVEGNKIELWEPNDAAYEKMGKEMGAKTTK